MQSICCDIDGVIGNFTSAYAHKLIAEGGNLLPKDWETNPEWPQEWYWERAAGYSPEVEKKVWNNHILQKGSKFWQNLSAYDGVKESLMHLNGLVKAGTADCYFLTHRMGDRAKNQTEIFLYEHGIDYPTVLLAADKIPYLRLLKAAFFIDDKPETVQEVARVAAEEKWQNFQLFLKIAPYNKPLWGDPRFKKAVSLKDALIQAGLWV